MCAKSLKYLLFSVALPMLASCSVYKYVPQGEYLLEDVSVEIAPGSDVSASSMKSLSKQSPNTRWLGLFRLPLRIYSISGGDVQETGSNTIFRNLGEKPVLLDSMACVSSCSDMQKSMASAGYLDASASFSINRVHGIKPDASVKYSLKPGKPYKVADIKTLVTDSIVGSILELTGKETLLKKGMNLDASVLDAERSRITGELKSRGYYSFNKECISFVADTAGGSHDVGLTMIVYPYSDENPEKPYPVYFVDSISYVLSESQNFSDDALAGFDRIERDGYSVYVKKDSLDIMWLKPETIETHSFLRQGRPYNPDAVSRTYSSLARLGMVKYTNIRFDEIPGTDALDCKVFMVSHPKRSLEIDIEGTNTAGDLGAAASVSTVNRNLFGGSEQLTLKLRGAYEAITALQGYSGSSYLERGAEANLTFPEFLFPFLSQNDQRRVQATSELDLKYNSQERPEFDKHVFSTSWSYLWSVRQHSFRYDMLDVSYLFVPWISAQFREEYLDPISTRNSILKYNYEDLLISRTGFTYYYSNAESKSGNQISLKLSVESSGNLLNALSKAIGSEPDEDGHYEVMNIAFAQYVKNDFSFTSKWHLGSNSDLLLHAEYGLAIPYANSTSLPFEKRYFAGGANSVRGWSVRELGPGSYMGETDAVNYITQSGDIKLGGSLELRSRLFWKVNGALFADAGNIWTVREYEEQPGGCFYWNQFYKQIAVSYGLGIRLDLDFLILRLDCGMKAINPAYSSGSSRYPIVHPDLNRDLALHFAVGYPF